jgi:hypothetical protein
MANHVTGTALSASQTRLWFLHQVDPADAAYHLADLWHIRGPLNVDALRCAVTDLVARQTSLNSRFVQVDGLPVRLPALAEPPLSEVRCADAGEAGKLAAALADLPFDLTVGPMIRFTLIRLDADDHLLSIVMHHIAADGWSIAILRRELAALYEAFDAGKPSPLAPLPMTYADHVRRQLDAPLRPAAVAYWKRLLADAPVMELRTDRPRPPVRDGRGDGYGFDVPRALFDRIDQLARAEKCTAFTALLAAFQVLLSRHSAQRDICVGVPVLGRDDPKCESIVGYFAETLVVRGDLDGDPPFRELLATVWAGLLAGFVHGAVPFEAILTESADRDLSRTPLFQAMLMHMRQGADTPRLGHLDIDFVDSPPRFAKTDIELDIFESPSSVRGIFIFDTSLFNSATIERMARRLLVLLADIVARPDARLSELRLFDEAEPMSAARGRYRNRSRS